MDVIPDNRASLVCRRIADNPDPGVRSVPAVCRLCRAPVWLALETLEMVKKQQRAGRIGTAIIVCVPCALPRMAEFEAVITGDDQTPGAAATAARKLGVDPSTPVINLDRTGRA